VLHNGVLKQRGLALVVLRSSGLQIFIGMLTTVEHFLSCSILVDILMVFINNCDPIVLATKKLATGMILCGVSFTIAALMICSCWRKLTKPRKDKVQPIDGTDPKFSQGGGRQEPKYSHPGQTI
jgi:hypothetical protein